MKPHRGLGRGLDALLGSPARTETASDEQRELAVTALSPGKHQPRRAFEKEALESLAESIKAQGVVQPLVVRPLSANKYEIVAGERRWRAAQVAGLKNVPVVIRNLDERGAMAVALVENIQRADLNPLEEAQALQKLVKECGLTHDKCAEAVGKSRAAVSNLLRLFELNEDVQALVRAMKLSFGHAKVLLGVSGARQSSLAKLAADQQLSVRALEALLHGADSHKIKTTPKRAPHRFESDVARRIGLPVRIQQSRSGRGVLSVAFKNSAELDKLLKHIK
ncbi:MAG: ParB/RepB/Spo0J family partition protein [Pseudomonadota bacterium]